MKKFVTISLAILSMNVFSQSYLVLNNGVTLTTDSNAFVYDFGHFIAPYKITLTGGQFFAEEEKLISVDTLGFLYRKDEKAPKKIAGKGINYIVSDSGVIITFDATGFMYKFDKDTVIKKASGFGGNFFTVKTDERKNIVDLYTVNSKGNYFKMDVAGLNPAEITNFGGNYFMTTKGVVYTVSQDGFVFAKPDIKAGLIRKIGGNFFIDANNLIYTVSAEGYLVLPGLPANLKIAAVTKLGANYFVDQDGKLFGVDKTGAIYQRELKDHDLTTGKIFSM